MYILGLSGHQRTAAAALLKDGRIVAAIEEEKLSRVKNIGIDQCGGLPYQAIGYCLEEAGVRVDEIDLLTSDLKPARLLRRQQDFGNRLSREDSTAAEDHRAAGEKEFRDRINTLNLIKRLLSGRAKIRPIDHQLAHAAGAFFLSGFERAAILVIGGRGDYISIAAGIGEGKKIRLLKRIAFPNSLGWVYSLITEYLGFSARGGEHNTQWLSLTGEPEFLPAFEELIQIDRTGEPAIDGSFFTPSLAGPEPFSAKFYARFGDYLRRKDLRFNDSAGAASWTELIAGLTGGSRTAQPFISYRRNLAHSLQLRLEQATLALAESIRREYRSDNLCLSGGVAANSLLVSKLEAQSGFRQVFVQPAPGNSGCSVGSALFEWHHQLDLGRPEPVDHIFWGPAFSDAEIKPELDNCKLAYRYINSEEKLLDEAVKLLSRGNIVAWFQGRAEFGPRSLGSRSILANPLLDYTKENLNLFVKHRENYRPFAASIPEERAAEFFEGCTRLSNFLLTVSSIKEDKKRLIPAAWFANGLVRVHTVNRKNNPLFWRLLTKFGEQTGAPILVNTSLNLFGEPIVCHPREAVRSCFCSGIDALIINRFIINK